MKITSKDILEISAAIRSTIDVHGVRESNKDSLLQDIIFYVASMVDNCQGSNIHESIINNLETYQSPRWLPKEIF